MTCIIIFIHSAFIKWRESIWKRSENPAILFTILSPRTLPPADGLPEKRCTPVSRPSRTAICISATAKALCIDFGTAEKFGGLCNLRMDDTNPAKEDTEFVDAIQEDIRWLGFDWGDRFFYGSDYFEKTYELRRRPHQKGSRLRLRADARGVFALTAATLTHPAVSPYRDRPIEESLDLFARMRAGEFPEGKYDAAREDRSRKRQLQHARPGASTASATCEHHRQGDEVVRLSRCTISPTPFRTRLRASRTRLCSLEFEDHRPLYNWVVENSRRARPSRARSSLPGSASTIP